MNKMWKNSESDTSKGSLPLTDTDLAGVSGGRKARKHDMKEVTFVIFTEGSVINGSPLK